MTQSDVLTDYVGAFVDELAKGGLQHVVISPGSRSTPMAILFAEHPDIKVWINIDERSAGYFALGIAKATKDPVAILCTSGTAAANYFPAIVEAKEARVPILVLTADRPHELRDVGAPQAIDQINLYGKYVKWFNEMALPESSAAMVSYVRTVAERALSAAKLRPSGPVHLNFPFREPLIPNLEKQDIFANGARENSSYVNVHHGKQKLDDELVQELAQSLVNTKKGLIVCGPMDDPELIEPVVKLAKTLQYPILADPLSQFRSGKHDKGLIIDSYDAILKSEMATEALAPEVIIRFGAMPISKPYLLYTKKHHQSRQIVIDDRDGWREPTLLADDIIYCDPSIFASSLQTYIEKINQIQDQKWVQRWTQLNRDIHQVVEGYLEQYPLSEGRIFYDLEKLIPEKSTIFVGNSMPVRDLDSFFLNTMKETRTMANRGANGIDGVVSTALGVSAVSNPVVLVIGDLSFFHDLNGLLAAKLHQLNIIIVLVNNDGGGIFSFLPQAKEKKHFEALFGTPIDIDFRHSIEMYKGSYWGTEDITEFPEIMKKAFDNNKTFSVVEVRSDREKNVREHRELTSAINELIAESLELGVN